MSSFVTLYLKLPKHSETYLFWLIFKISQENSIIFILYHIFHCTVICHFISLRQFIISMSFQNLSQYLQGPNLNQYLSNEVIHKKLKMKQIFGTFLKFTMPYTVLLLNENLNLH